MDVMDFELFLRSEEMRQTPEFGRLMELDCFSNSLRIFEANYRELDRLMWFVCESVPGSHLFRRENRSAWEQATHEVVRLLQNFVASVSALVDHSRGLYSRLYETERTFTEYPEEVRKRFVENPLVQFVHNLRNYCLHYRTPRVGTTMTLVDVQNEVFKRHITLGTEDLAEFEWNAAAHKFLEGAGEEVDIRSVLRDYHLEIEGFYKWFAEKARTIHAADHATMSAYYAEQLKGRSERNVEALTERLRAFECGVGSIVDTLSPFMTPSDASALDALMSDPNKWAIAALEKVSTYVSITAEVRQRILAAVVKFANSSPVVGQ
jgi:hypothetical protein